MHPLSGSKLGLAVICPGSHTLPWPKEKKSPSAVRGDRIHRYLEYKLEGEAIDWVALDIPPALRKLCKAIDLTSATGDLINPKAEAAMVWDPAASKARLLGHRIGRDYDKYGRQPGEMSGSADVVGFHGTLGHPVVVDYKTGRHIGPVKDSWQMRFLSLMTAHTTGWSRCEARVVYIDWYGNLTVESHLFDSLDLDSDSAEIQELLAKISSQEPEFSYGEHCDRMFCPARQHCNVYSEGVAA